MSFSLAFHSDSPLALAKLATWGEEVSTFPQLNDIETKL